MRLYPSELTALRLSVSRTPLEPVRTGRELFFSNLAIDTRLWRARPHERGTQAAREAADVS